MEKVTEQQKTPVLDKIFEKLLLVSPQHRELKQNLEDLVKNVTNLAQALVKLAQTVSLQRQDIEELHDSQRYIVDLLKKNAKESSQSFAYKKPSDEELN